MEILDQVVVFDSADLETESTFWAGVLGGVVDRDDDWHMVLVDGRPRIGVQLDPEHIRPDWPDGTSQQIHLDLWVEDSDPAHEHVTALGAQVLKPTTEEPGSAYQVYADPSGHQFCLCWRI